MRSAVGCLLPPRTRHRVLFLVLFASGCGSSGPVGPEPSSPPGFEASGLARARSQVSTVPGMGCLVVARGGSTVFEDCYGVARADAPDDVRSVTKSVTSLLVGLAIDEGFLPGVDSAMGPWLQPAATTVADDRARITIRQLLTMTSGFDWYEGGDYTLFNEWLRAPSQVDFLLARPLAFPPGSHYTYNTAASHLLSIVIQQATGQRLDAWARSRLLAPLGIGERRWLTDAQGFCHGGIGL